MKTRYQPFELIDCLRDRGIVGQLGVDRIWMPDHGWYFALNSADLYEAKEGMPPRLLVNLSIHDDAEVIASYIASYQAALRKRAVA